MQLAERILRELAVSPLLTRQLAARLEANRPGIMVAEVLRLSGGRMREVLNILANIERIAATNGLSGQLDVPQFAGVALTHDWQSRTAKTVKAR